MKSSRKAQVEKTKWYSIDKRAPFISSRVVGLNLQGKPQKFFFLKELQSTIFLIEFSIFCYTWRLNKSFDEMKEFCSFIVNDRSLLRGKDLLKAPFPPGKDGEVDVMILVERREMIEAYIKEVVTTIDFEMYEPLDNFIQGTKNLQRLLAKLAIIKKFFRQKLAKKKLLSRLYRFYSKELMDFVYTMENGVEVCNIDPNLPPESRKKNSKTILWLDVCEEPGLSRLCLAPKKIFDLPKDFEDERLAYGVFLSDIAEVRRGVSSHTFSLLPPNSLAGEGASSGGWLKPEQCVSVVGSERTLSFQFLATTTPNSFTGPGPNTSKLHVKAGFAVHRLLWCDLLSLLMCQSLPSEDLSLRQRRFRRFLVHPSLHCPSSTRSVDQKLVADGKKTTKLLLQGLDIEVEAGTGQSVSRFLRYDEKRNALVIDGDVNGIAQISKGGNEQETTAARGATSLTETNTADTIGCNSEKSKDGDAGEESGEGEEEEEDEEEEEEEEVEQEEADSDSLSPDNMHAHWWFTSDIWHTNTMTSTIARLLARQEIVIPLDDLAEIRPGKVSAVVDNGEDHRTCITFVSSSAILILPLGDASLRNTLLRKFQSFLSLRRNLDSLLYEDLLSVFTPNNTSAAMADYRPPILPDPATLSTLTSSHSHTVQFTAENNDIPKKKKRDSNKSSSKKKKASKEKKTMLFDVPIGATPAYHRYVTPMSSINRMSSNNRVSVSSIRRSSTSSRGTFSFTPSLSQNYNVSGKNTLLQSQSGDSCHSPALTPYRHFSED